MTQNPLSIVQFRMAIIGSCLFLICASIAVRGQGGSGTLVNTPAKATTPAKSAPSKSSKKKSPTASKAQGTRRTNNARDAAAATERTYWESIRNSSQPEDFRAYLNKYPNGEFIDLAKNKLRVLEAAKAKSNSVKDNTQSSENTSPAWQMVGVWRAVSTEFGSSMEITYTANADGTYQFFARNAQGATAQDYGLWQYSNGILYQKFSNGGTGKGSIEWLDRNTFVLTIIDNGTPAYNGVKRRYHRVK
jgi:hypothetical protein